jgi:hypothetical protein
VNTLRGGSHDVALSRVRRKDARRGVHSTTRGVHMNTVNGSG